MTAPTSDQQVTFLGNIQRLLAEGSFVATYKHALLLALADLSVELGDDSGSPITLPVSAVAEKFVTYYWRQALPFPSPRGTNDTLRQNTGRQAAIVTLIAAAHERAGGPMSMARARQHASWPRLIAKVADVVKTMPLWKLQRVGDDVLEFLYPNVTEGDSIELKPGVAFCFRRFHGLIEDLVRGAWVRFVRGLKENQRLLGDIADLDEFLFGSDRASLAAYRPILSDVQAGRCLYCLRRVDESAAIDHFIPWVRYPIDLGHNFVLAHGSCNGSKADRLASVEHLERWCARNATHGEQLDRAFAAANILADRATSIRVTRWAYGQVSATDGLVWVKAEELVPLDARWKEILAASSPSTGRP